MIFLIRHGETIWNTEGRRQGRGDSALTDAGVAQSRAVAQQLRLLLEGEKRIHVATSPAGRSRRTAAIIAEELGIDQDRIQATPMLEEMDFGDWQGLTDDEIAERFPDQWRERQLNRWGFAYPNGESYPLLCSRVAEWMENAQEQGGVTIAVTHQWTSRVIRGQYLKLPKQEMFALMHPHRQIIQLHNDEEKVILVEETRA
ncbi:histidine phosphatase family protein [Natronospirillum operosum]|uniref:Histidine phosphatase family protein n=1 Tax=Natronospirillum operosum TaxID=2759953 RepID=A0A4Z0WAW7_9GAMM|nr:histidine phosphatase family protein [Natronospirillum operosum]TGG90637.1 histidine phosphatase family protein [Natronospirillum operosum]